MSRTLGPATKSALIFVPSQATTSTATRPSRARRHQRHQQPLDRCLVPSQEPGDRDAAAQAPRSGLADRSAFRPNQSAAPIRATTVKRVYKSDPVTMRAAGLG